MLKRFSVCEVYRIDIERLWREVATYRSPLHRRFGMYRLARLPVGEAQAGQKIKAGLTFLGIPMLLNDRTVTVVSRSDAQHVLRLEEFATSTGLWRTTRTLTKLSPSSTELSEDLEVFMGPWSGMWAWYARRIVKDRHKALRRKLEQPA